MDSGVVIKTDSSYCVNGWDGWLATWFSNGWRTAEGKSVKNQDLWREMHRLKSDICRTGGSGIEVRLEWVKGHSGNVGNEEADRLAVNGIKAPQSLPDGKRPDQDLQNKLKQQHRMQGEPLTDAGSTTNASAKVTNTGDLGGEELRGWEQPTHCQKTSDKGSGSGSGSSKSARSKSSCLDSPTTIDTETEKSSPQQQTSQQQWVSEIDFRTFFVMPPVMPRHWEQQPLAQGAVSFADVVRDSPPDVAGIVVSTFSLNLYVRKQFCKTPLFWQFQV